ncbi:hypothetical protein LSH36_211g02047 [Paralvinella palmiformis]|uniref:Death domain-containing protein n=1 Tax=Paralvinella palmiformis TaxID=53620 RepID=A0AAD9JNX7_9ANNE|nr:hypothetical protein LSH36_211g02047 [Paralvinella palmiformis]
MKISWITNKTTMLIHKAKDESSVCVTKEHINELVKRLADDWKKLGTELGFSEDDMKDTERKTDEKEAQANRMLTVWIENEADKATVELLRSALKEIGEEVIATEVFGEHEDS